MKEEKPKKLSDKQRSDIANILKYCYTMKYSEGKTVEVVQKAYPKLKIDSDLIKTIATTHQLDQIKYDT